MRVMPRQRPGRSEQTVCTPRALLEAVEAWYGPLVLDAAALPENAVAPKFWTPEDDGLVQPWESLTWCNPPFGQCARWVEKAVAEMARADSLILVPASVGANWWRDWVHEVAAVSFLNGRVTFVGHTGPYPKDLAILHYSYETIPGYTVWDWRLR